MSTNRPMKAWDVLVASVTSLPTGSDRYEGRTVDYWPSGTVGSGDCWTLRWRGAARSGSGGWVVVSPQSGLRAVASASFDLTSSPSYSYSNMTNGPNLSIPMAMRCYFIAQFETIATAAGADSLTELTVNGSASGFQARVTHNEANAYITTVFHTPVLALAASDTVNFRCATNGIKVTWGNYVKPSIIAVPVLI